MGSRISRGRTSRKTSVETLEIRQVFSADPLGGLLGSAIEHHIVDEAPPLEAHGAPVVAQRGQEVPAIELHGEDSLVQHVERTADFWYDVNLDQDLDALFGGIEQTLASAHALTGAVQARDIYGFTGIGQTIVVIDSGIAYDHYALGGGFGAGYRVVGGWDFTENDANPYDDGPAGGHGTHVAGIIGAQAGTTGDSGVAPGADLVALRVFDDAGNGYFSWVEKALRWVVQNRNAFENPITAVNLSLGTAWNSASVPSWAMLEDEFAQMASHGIFISVSAGNSFTTYNTTGLSYPAASSHVVPVMSVDDNGYLSYFSQRHERAIAAPGRTIRSTVPDYAGNRNGIADDWANYSGTSMAAPYVAGASAIVRQAMEFVGFTNIDQWDIYDHMMATADSFFDAATNRWYQRLNLKNAIDALMPLDDFGSSVVDAYDLGTLGSGSNSLNGSITTLTDSDYFRFTSSVTGTVTITTTTTHQMAAAWHGDGVVTGENTYTIDVVAGQTYTFGLATSNGLGHYSLTIDVESTFTFTDWGIISLAEMTGISVGGDAWYRVTASQAGFLTAAAAVADGGVLNLAWYGTDMQPTSVTTASTGDQRIDHLVAAGDQLYLRVSGSCSSIDVRLANLVSIDGMTATVSGTDGDDTFTFVAGTTEHVISVNGVAYSFAAETIASIVFQGGDGKDTITMTGSAGNEVATLRVGEGQLIGTSYIATALDIENMILQGGGGTDQVTLYDSTGNDIFGGWSNKSVMYGAEYSYTVYNFSNVVVHSTNGGVDQARFYDSAGNDVFGGWSDRAVMYGAGYSYFANGFTSVVAYSTQGGNDQARFYDSAGDDIFGAWSNRAVMYGNGYSNSAHGFMSTIAYSTQGGNDQARFYDSVGNDVFGAWWNKATMYGTAYSNTAHGFSTTVAYSTLGGNDQARFYDSAGDDTYTAWRHKAVMTGANFSNTAFGFANTIAYSTLGGNDQARFYDSAGNDTFVAWSNRATMYGTGYSNDARGFRSSIAHATAGGYNRAMLYNSAGDDLVGALAWGTYLSGNGFHNEARGFDEISALLVNGGSDTVNTEATEYAFFLMGHSA